MLDENEVHNIVPTNNTGDINQAGVNPAGTGVMTDELAVEINQQQSNWDLAREWARQIKNRGTAKLAQQLAGIRSLTSWNAFVEYFRNFGDGGGSSFTTVVLSDITSDNAQYRVQIGGVLLITAAVLMHQKGYTSAFRNQIMNYEFRNDFRNKVKYSLLIFMTTFFEIFCRVILPYLQQFGKLSQTNSTRMVNFLLRIKLRIINLMLPKFNALFQFNLS